MQEDEGDEVEQSLHNWMKKEGWNELQGMSGMITYIICNSCFLIDEEDFDGLLRRMKLGHAEMRKLFNNYTSLEKAKEAIKNMTDRMR